jgi:mannitol/fructose-specific phosphotransferase system IIA component (Ntr-type)
MLQYILRLKKPRRFVDYLQAQGFVSPLQATDRWEAIRELSLVTAPLAGLDAKTVTAAVLARERMMATGIGKGLAVPHARLPNLTAPIVAIGLSAGGVDFDSPDDTLAQVVCLILTPIKDDGAQLEILADIATTFKVREIREKVVSVAGFTEFLALVRSGQGR